MHKYKVKLSVFVVFVDYHFVLSASREKYFFRNASASNVSLRSLVQSFKQYMPAMENALSAVVLVGLMP